MSDLAQAVEACTFQLFGEAREGEFRNAEGEMEPVFFIPCPGKNLHSTKNRDSDACVRYTSHTYPVTVFCFHTQCEQDRKIWSKRLRDLLRSKGALAPVKRNRKKTPEQLAWIQALKTAKGIENKYPLLFAELDDSFFATRLGLSESREAFWNLFPPNAVLWNGEEFNSGVRGIGHFNTVAEWRKAPLKFLGQFTTPGTYRPGETSRTKAALVTVLYFIIEFDGLDPDPVRNQIKTWILVHWLAKAYNLKLRLCVDSGGKSLHFWVEYTPNVTPYIFHILKALGADWKVLRSGAQPVRFPGVIRQNTNRPQCVILL